MAKFIVFFVAALAFHATLAAPKKNQTPGATAKNQIEELASQVENVVNDVSASLKKVLPDNKQVSKVLVDQSNELVQNLQKIVKKLEAEIEKNRGNADDVLKQITGKVTENIDALRQAIGPDATAKANQIRTDVEKHFKSTAVEFEKLVKVVQPNVQQAGETVNTFAKGVLNDFIKAAENLKTQVDSALQSSQKPKK